MKTPAFIQIHRLDDRVLADEASAGLMGPRAAVSPKFFYDPLGSRLFDAITELGEYYPTRTEAAILGAHGPAIGAAAIAMTGPAPVLVDLGAGNCAKAERLFGLVTPRRYVAVDISVDFLRHSLQCLQREHPAMDMVGVGQDFSSRLALPPEVVDGPALMFYPGSSIGNFTPDEAVQLLRQAHHTARGGALLIGVDHVKAAPVLQAAYDDDLGVTAAFNLNLLKHLNRLLGADFDVRQWRHVALYDARASRIEMHLEAREAIVVRWPGHERRFAAGERLHTENSYKWTPDRFAALLHEAGFSGVRHWSDAQAAFGVYLAKA